MEGVQAVVRKGRGAESRTWARGQLKHGWAPSRAQIWCDGPPQTGLALSRAQTWCDGPPQIGWAPGFVISKKKRSSPKFRLFFRPKSSDLQKKRSSPKFRMFPPPKKVDPCDFEGPFVTQCNLDGPSLELMGPGVIVPPSRRPWGRAQSPAPP